MQMHDTCDRTMGIVLICLLSVAYISRHDVGKLRGLLCVSLVCPGLPHIPVEQGSVTQPSAVAREGKRRLRSAGRTFPSGDYSSSVSFR